MKMPEAPVGAELQSLPEALTSLGNTIAELRQGFTMATARAADPLMPCLVDVPPELSADPAEFRQIAFSGPLVQAMLARPETAEQALDCLLDLTAVLNIEPDLAPEISGPLVVLDTSLDLLTPLVAGASPDTAAKALRLLCHRAAEGKREAIQRLATYIPTIAGYGERRTQPTPLQQQLYRDVLDALSVRLPCPARDKADQLQFAFLNGLGFDFRTVMDDWAVNGKVEHADKTARRNFETILRLEAMEPGLARNIHETFRTTVFSRYEPEVWADMYRQRRDNPQLPYVLSVDGLVDHTLALERCDPPAFFRKLLQHGVRFEAHQCSTPLDVGRVVLDALAQHATHGSEVVTVLTVTHGLPDQMELGRSRYDRLTSENVAVLTDIEPALSKDARFILTGCLNAVTAANGRNIAQTIASLTGRATIAQRTASSLYLQAKARGQHIQIEPYYLTEPLFHNRMRQLWAFAATKLATFVPSGLGQKAAQHAERLRKTSVKQTFLP